MMERLKDRYIILSGFFVIVAFIIIAALINLQIRQGKEFDIDAQKGLPNIRTIIAPRGNIEDKNGVPIAVNRMGFVLQIVKAGLDSDKLNNMLLNLVNILEKNNNSYYKSFNRYITPNPIRFGSAINKSKDPIAVIKRDFNLKLKDGVVLKTAEDVFKYLRETKYKINDNYTVAEAYKIMSMRYEIRDYTSLKSIPLAADISKETVAEVEERHHDFAGVSTDTEPLRQYIDAPDVAHVLGYIRGISDTEYDKFKNQGYKMTDFIGKSGIELAAEQYLKGTDGDRSVEVDTEGRLTKELNSKPAIPGDKVVLTLDMKLQKVAMDSLKKNIDILRNRGGRTGIKTNFGDASAGSVVALDVNTGEVLAMASYPTYDPSIFLEGAENKDAQNAIRNLNNPGTPELNRAITASYEPGSTFKPILGVAGLEEGVITPKSTINDPGVITVDDFKLKCLEYENGSKPNGHGDINLASALATSCNMYFFKLGMLLHIDRIDKWTKLFGLGEKTGIEIGGEKKGRRSNMETHYAIYPKDGDSNYNWGSVLTAFSSIGQLYNNYTPLQMANYVASIANGGKRYVPHLIKRVVKYDGSIVLETKPSYFQIPVKKETIDAVKQGMVDVANSSEGTAAEVFSDFTRSYNITVAGKTGTAQTPESQKGLASNNGVFICYAPADNPKIAIAVVVEKGVQGRYTAPIAKDILAEYFNVNNKNSVDDVAKADTVELTR